MKPARLFGCVAQLKRKANRTMASVSPSGRNSRTTFRSIMTPAGDTYGSGKWAAGKRRHRAIRSRAAWAMALLNPERRIEVAGSRHRWTAESGCRQGLSSISARRCGLIDGIIPGRRGAASDDLWSLTGAGSRSLVDPRLMQGGEGGCAVDSCCSPRSFPPVRSHDTGHAHLAKWMPVSA